MVDLRRSGFNHRPGRTFVVHFDEETVITEPHLLLLVDYLATTPRPLSQGPILYPLEWAKSPWICRAMEATRPFGCSECAEVMKHPPPPHLHGSNLVVDEDVEDRIGWDFGTVDGQAFIAEDLLFGMRAYALYGDEAFGWHGASVLEQPPLSLYWAIQQRVRWVLGALQGLRALRIKPEFDDIPKRRRISLGLSVYARIATYALGFPIGLVGLLFVVHPEAVSNVASPMFALRVALLLSAVAWIVSYQIGMHRNLRYQRLPWYRQAGQHVVMLVLTPVVGLCETSGPYVALVRWLLGRRRASWTPTPKLADQPARVIRREPVDIPRWIPVPAGAAVASRSIGGGQPTRRPARNSMFTIGLGLVGVATAIALWVGYEFGGTAVLYDRSQQVLLLDFQQNVAASAGTIPSDGAAMAILSIPRLDATEVVVQGTSPADLEQGPGHYMSSPMPGEFGNVLIMGRRTTYGGPFRDLDQLVPGDHITLTTANGTFTYVVTTLQSTSAGQAQLLDGTPDSRLTLITSTPEYLPTGRLAVVAKLQGNPLDLPKLTAAPVKPNLLGLAGDPNGALIAAAWAVLLLVAIALTVRLGRRWPVAVRNLLATPVLLTLFLLVCINLGHALPGML
ncbi:MAG: sortase, partial [Chloroflexi bacterium]|nr:sortase [Chloroflexota bacterium]